MTNWDTFIRFGVNLGEDSKKKIPRFPKNWQKLTKSQYRDEDNFAILTGQVNDIFVIDIDTKNEMPGLQWFCDNFGGLKECNTLVTKSWSGGYHIFFKYSPFVKTTSWNNLHIDIRSDGGCIFQGKNYDILYNKPIRTLSGPELCIFTNSEKTKVYTSTDLEQDEKILLRDFVFEKYKFYEEDIRDYIIDSNTKSIIVALDTTKCPFIKRSHKSNHQYIVFNSRGSKQRCHDPECKDNIYGEIKKLPKEIKELIVKYVPTSKEEEMMIEQAEKECKKFIMAEYKDTSSLIKYDRESGNFSGFSDVIHNLFSDNCKPCTIEYVIDSNGQYLKCTKCGQRFPKTTTVCIPRELYPNIHQVLINYTVNNYNSNEFDETLEYNIEKQIFEDEHIWYLVNESLNGCKSGKIAELLHEYTKDFVYDVETEKGTWYYFDGNIWSKDNSNLEMNTKIIELYSEYFERVKNYYRAQKTDSKIINCINNFHNKLEKPALKKEIVEEAKRFFVDKKFHKKLNSNYYLIPFNNGVIDFQQKSEQSDENLESGESERFWNFRITDKSDHIELTHGYDFNNKIFNTKVSTFINQILPDKEIRDYVLKCCSNCINPYETNEEMLLLIGNGANGKTQLLNLMLKTMGDLGEKLGATLLTRKRKDAGDANSELAKLIHKRFAFVSEPEHNETFNISNLKELTGSENIVARSLYKEPVTFPMITHFFIACNKLPKLPSDLDVSDESLTRRLRVIEFKSKFVKNPKKDNEYLVDKTIKQQIDTDITWRQTFMNILVSYFHREIDVPQSVLLKTNQYKQLNNDYEIFVNENIESSPGEILQSKELVLCFNNGVEVRSNTKKNEIRENCSILIKQLYGEEYVETTYNGNKLRGWRNIRIK